MLGGGEGVRTFCFSVEWSKYVSFPRSTGDKARQGQARHPKSNRTSAFQRAEQATHCLAIQLDAVLRPASVRTTELSFLSFRADL